jgi:sRNA-binding carbon storage regulator CsrA
VNAPREVAVHREQIYERIKAEEGQGEDQQQLGNTAEAWCSFPGKASFLALINM